MKDFIATLLQCSASMSLITLVYMAILPLLSKRYTAKWRYIVWLIIAAGWIFPFKLQIHLTSLPVQMLDISTRSVYPITNTIQSIINTGSVTNVPASIPLWQIFMSIWILGLVSVVLYHAFRHRRFIKMINRWSEPVTNPKSLEILDSLKSELGIKSHLRLRMCQNITSPMLVGFFQSDILLPPIKITDDELSFILKHELIHFKRHDLWYKILILASTVLHWFNPVVYLMSKSAAVQCEISCDALALKDAGFHERKQYGETIIGIVRNGAKLQTALTTNFYGGKNNMETRIFSIMDNKQKKAGIVIFCFVLIGIISHSVTFSQASIKEEKDNAEIFAIYEQYGLTYNKDTDQLFYKGELVRYFEDYYTIGDNKDKAYSGIDYFNEHGTIDVHGIRDLSKLTHNPDGSTDPSGKLIGVKPYSQAEFDARDIEKLKNPQIQATSIEYSGSNNSYAAQELINGNSSSGNTTAVAGGPQVTPEELAKLYAIYEPFGVSYDKNKDCFYYDGKLVKRFVDILESNGEPLSGGKFEGFMRQMGNPDGEIEIKAIRDYTKLDTNGYGTLIGIEVVK